MTTNNYALVVAAMLLAILLTNFGLFIAPAISSESVEQERTLCIENCKYRYWPPGDDWRLYFKCVDDCEKNSWRKWQKDMDKLEKD
ncbi:MAG: hypothetical protein WC647_06395 [Desulfomonilaceae bacterium]|jgi:hypothetical protein